jgi:hypothetical protein
MIFFMVQSGVSVELGQILFFAAVTIAGIIISVAFYKKIEGIVALKDKSEFKAEGAVS